MSNQQFVTQQLTVLGDVVVDASSTLQRAVANGILKIQGAADLGYTSIAWSNVFQSGSQACSQFGVIAFSIDGAIVCAVGVMPDRDDHALYALWDGNADLLKTGVFGALFAPIPLHAIAPDHIQSLVEMLTLSLEEALLERHSPPTVYTIAGSSDLYLEPNDLNQLIVSVTAEMLKLAINGIVAEDAADTIRSAMTVKVQTMIPDAPSIVELLVAEGMQTFYELKQSRTTDLAGWFDVATRRN